MVSTVQRDRIAGVLLGQACGDALGVPYEFESRRLDEAETPQMRGGGLGNFLPGEFSDDTQMALCIAWAPQKTGSLTSPAALNAVAENFLMWFGQHPADVGNQTRAVLSAAARNLANGNASNAAEACAQAAAEFTASHERSAGNGALMRGGIVGLVGVTDGREAMAKAARDIAALTHADDLVLDSCVLLAEAVRVAVIEARLDILAGLDLVPAERQNQWREWLKSAAGVHPNAIELNGSTFGALRAAWAAITSTDTGESGHLKRALELAVRCRNDTDTVAAIAGVLMGARYGVSGIPAQWRRAILGWNGSFPVTQGNAVRARDLIGLSLTAAGEAGPGRWPYTETHNVGGDAREVSVPFDDGLTLGNQAALMTSTADAVVSLSRVGVEEAAGPNSRPLMDRVETWVIDSDDPADNQDLYAALLDAAAAVDELRREGKTVLLHCVHMHHRTPSVAFLYATEFRGVEPDEAAAQIKETLGVSHIDGLLWQTVTEGRARRT